TAVLNADDQVVMSYRARTSARVVTYGTTSGDIRADRVEIDADGRARFDLVSETGRASVALPVPGEHMVPNALAAAAVGISLGIPVDDCAAALAEARISAGRMEVFDTPGGIRVVNDAYNANPTSMAAALRAVRWMSGARRSVAVLGHMAELGPIGPQEHDRIGQLVARLGIGLLVVVGDDAELIAVAAEREGVEPERIHRVDDVEDAIHLLPGLLRAGDVVLVKASRVVRLERLAGALGGPDGASAPRDDSFAAVKGAGA
ncbi:MAG: glutamate ligase domain-containing protein, partial [Actinomycetota bacterium]